MAILRIRPHSRLWGRCTVPGDKSISHRALLFGALADGVSQVRNFLPGGDCQATLSCLRALGVEIEEHSWTEVIVHGVGLHGLREPADVLNCVNSGTTTRLLIGILAGQPCSTFLTGSEQLRRRPMKRVTEPLRTMNAQIMGRGEGRYLPLGIRGGNLHAIDYTLPVASAQVKSALLLAGLYAEGLTTVREPGPARDHTERLLRAMGAPIEQLGHIITSERPQRLEPMNIDVPGDPSSAAFLAVGAIIAPQSDIVIRDVSVNPTRTGLFEVLAESGAQIESLNERESGGEPLADLRFRCSSLRATTVQGNDIVRMIDELPIFAVAATQAHGVTQVKDAAELRVKETDRIATTVAELRKLGARIEEQPDGFIVEGPTRLFGGVVNSHGDHRLAMALAVAGLIAESEIVIEDAECIADSFPGFDRTFAVLGADLSLGG